MTASQFRTALSALGVTRDEWATLSGYSIRRVHSYANGEDAIPVIVERLLRVLVETRYPIARLF